MEERDLSAFFERGKEKVGGGGGGRGEKGDSRERRRKGEMGGGCCYTEELAGECGLIQSRSGYL